MLKFIVVVHKRADMSHEEFRGYFQRVHVRLAKKLPGLLRYVQNFPQPDPARKLPQWDAVIELYFDDHESMEAAWASPEGAASDADLPNFADLARTTWSVVEESISTWP
jgi:uncharacterized protein (TIGR02118 family)